ncbi:hypothetical protein CEXT_13751 [Caerostris extrusa]|uniref:Uncharacterized protein n=1 Tax=Caerostris extrusa TaxID=172846 RepID=A0AAV4SBE3_CAEEX|nr:hypothetical protein CEXT_13751 [Caerostris extrusa]
MEKIGLKKKEEDLAINANDCYMRDDDLPPVSSDESDEDDVPPTSSDKNKTLLTARYKSSLLRAKQPCV